MIFIINFVFCEYKKGYNRRFVLCREKGNYYKTIKIWVGEGNIKKALSKKTINSIISFPSSYYITVNKKEGEKEKERERRIISLVLNKYFGIPDDKNIKYHVIYTNFR